MHDPAHRAVASPPQLAFYADILPANGAKTLHERRVGIELCVLETRNEAIAALAHAPDLRAVERQVELVLVGLCNACIVMT